MASTVEAEKEAALAPTPSIATSSRTPTENGNNLEEIQDVLSHKISRAQSAQGQRDPEKAVDDDASDTPSVREVHGFKWFLVCLSLYLSALIYGLDTTIAADVQGAVVETFGNVQQLAWMGVGFPLGSVATVLPIGFLYTSFNQKWLYIGSIVLFEAGSALCGGAPSMKALIVGRVIAGIGGSGIYLGVLNYLSMMTSATERGTYISLTGLVWGLGCILGPVVGGAFSISGATWRWAFYINLVIAAVSAPIYILFLPAIRPVTGVSIQNRLARIDYLGILLNAGFWVTFAIVLTFAGGEWRWTDGRTIATFVVFGILLIAFIIQQRFSILTTPTNRSFPVHMLESRTQVLLYIGTAASVASMFVTVYMTPIYFQFVHGDSALTAAVRLLPFVLIAVSTNMAAGYLLPKISYYMPMYLVSGIFVTLGGALLMTHLDPSTSPAKIYGFEILAAFGTGITLQLGYSIATVKAAAHDIGHALAFQNVAQIGGIVISLVIAGQVFQSTAIRNLEAVLAGLGFSTTDIHNAVAGAQSTVFETLSGELREQAVLAITKAMQKVFIMVIVAGAVITVAAAAMRRDRLFNAHPTAGAS